MLIRVRLTWCLILMLTVGFTASRAGSAKEMKPQTKVKATKSSLKASSPAKAAVKKSAERSSVQPSKSRAPIALFAVSQNRNGAALDPIVIISGGKYINPPSGTAQDARLKKFADEYYRTGQKYRLLFGGGEAGTVTVKQWNYRKECSRTEASAVLSGDARINVIRGRVMGLATNSDSLGRRSRSRRAPSDKERDQIEALARQVYRRKGITSDQLPQVRTINMTATDLNGDRKAEIIGTFLLKRIKGMKTAHILFVIAEPKGDSYKVAFTQYGQITAKDVGGAAPFDELGETALAEVLVDQIDLDRDGAAEVIIADLTREGIAYKIFQKQKSGWRKAYEFYNYRCAN